MGEAKEWPLHPHANPMKIFRKNPTQTEYIFARSLDMAKVFGIGIERGSLVIDKNQAQVNIFQMPSSKWKRDWERENVFTIDVEKFLILVSEKKGYFPSRSLDSVFVSNVSVHGQGSSSGGDQGSSSGGGGGLGGGGSTHTTLSGAGGAGGEDVAGSSGLGTGAGGSGEGGSSSGGGREHGFLGSTSTTVIVREREVKIIVHLFDEGVTNLENLTCPLGRFHVAPVLVFIFMQQQDGQPKLCYNFTCETTFEASEVVAEHRIDDNTIRQGTLHDELMVEFGPNQSRIVGMRSMKTLNTELSTMTTREASSEGTFSETDVGGDASIGFSFIGKGQVGLKMWKKWNKSHLKTLEEVCTCAVACFGNTRFEVHNNNEVAAAKLRYTAVHQPPIGSILEKLQSLGKVGDRINFGLGKSATVKIGADYDTFQSGIHDYTLRTRRKLIEIKIHKRKKHLLSRNSKHINAESAIQEHATLLRINHEINWSVYAGGKIFVSRGAPPGERSIITIVN